MLSPGIKPMAWWEAANASTTRPWVASWKLNMFTNTSNKNHLRIFKIKKGVGPKREDERAWSGRSSPDPIPPWIKSQENPKFKLASSSSWKISENEKSPSFLKHRSRTSFIQWPKHILSTFLLPPLRSSHQPWFLTLPLLFLSSFLNSVTFFIHETDEQELHDFKHGNYEGAIETHINRVLILNRNKIFSIRHSPKIILEIESDMRMKQSTHI